MIESEIIVALGSNTYSRENIEKAKRLLTERFGPETVFSSFMKTSPIGMSGPDFINCIMATRSTLTTEQATAALKETERLCGDTQALRSEGKVLLDADLLLCQGKRHHLPDWQRPYIMELLNELKQQDNNISKQRL